MSDYYKSSLSLPHAAVELKMDLTSLRVLVLEGNINAVRGEDGVWRIKPAELDRTVIRRSTSGFPSYNEKYLETAVHKAVVWKLQQRGGSTLDVLVELLPGTHHGQLRPYVRGLLRRGVVRYQPGGVLELTGDTKSMLLDSDRRASSMERQRNSGLAARV